MFFNEKKKKREEKPFTGAGEAVTLRSYWLAGLGLIDCIGIQETVLSHRPLFRVT